ncbi:MAG: 2-aminoadipate transaminase [Desulfovibrio sp.]
MRNDSGSKLYLKLYQSIEQDIINGRLKPGDRLPSYRRAARKYDISMATVVHAHNKLAEDGIIEIIQGSGCYVKAVNARDYFSDQIVLENFGEGQVPGFPVVNFSSASPFIPAYPMEAFNAILAGMVEEGLDPALFAYGRTQGKRRLRALLQEYLARQCQIAAREEDIHIVNGGQQGIDLVCKLFRGRAFSVIVENPGYTVAVNSFVNAGASVFPVALENDGCDLTAMRRVLEKRRVDLVYLMTNFQSPTGICWSDEKKQRLLALAEEFDFLIIEDDCWSEIYFDDTPRTSFKTLDSGKALNSGKALDSGKAQEAGSRVIYIKSFSKILMPGLRLAFMAAPARLHDGLVAAKFYADIASGGLTQEIFARFMEGGLLETHAAHLRERYARKYLLMRDLIRESGCLEIAHDPGGGLCFWVRILPEVDSYAFYRKMRKSNIRLLPGNLFSRDGTHGTYLRLSFAVPSEDEMRWGFRQIVRSLT